MKEMIVATGRNLEIGKDNKLLWDIPSEMQFFREYTLDKNIVMGRKTYESIGKPLPRRNNIVLTSQDIHGVECIRSIEELESKYNNYIIIGGSAIYDQMIMNVDVLWISTVKKYYPQADSHFPEFENYFKNKVEIIDNELFSSHKYTK